MGQPNVYIPLQEETNHGAFKGKYLPSKISKISAVYTIFVCTNFLLYFAPISKYNLLSNHSCVLFGVVDPTNSLNFKCACMNLSMNVKEKKMYFFPL